MREDGISACAKSQGMQEVTIDSVWVEKGGGGV